MIHGTGPNARFLGHLCGRFAALHNWLFSSGFSGGFVRRSILIRSGCGSSFSVWFPGPDRGHGHGSLPLRFMTPAIVFRNDKRGGIGAFVVLVLEANAAFKAGLIPIPPVEDFAVVQPTRI